MTSSQKNTPIPWNRTQKRNNSPAFPAVAVLGPTASGKSSLALQIAEQFKGEIVSCDSVQVYRYLNIGSSKPGPEETEKIPHHMIDLITPDLKFDVASFKIEAEKCIGKLASKGKLPIVTGGTGMYFNALYYGLFEAPPRNPEIRRKYQIQIKNNGLESLYLRLKDVDRKSAEIIHPNDQRRIERALEIFDLTSEPASVLKKKKNKVLNIRWFLIALNHDRQKLYEKINQRTVEMLRQGWIEEVENILKSYPPDSPGLQSIGYKQIVNYLIQRKPLDEIESEIQLVTRHYAKRQLTWFRKNQDIQWYTPENLEELYAHIRNFLNQ